MGKKKIKNKWKKKKKKVDFHGGCEKRKGNLSRKAGLSQPCALCSSTLELQKGPPCASTHLQGCKGAAPSSPRNACIERVLWNSTQAVLGIRLSGLSNSRSKTAAFFFFLTKTSAARREGVLLRARVLEPFTWEQGCSHSWGVISARPKIITRRLVQRHTHQEDIAWLVQTQPLARQEAKLPREAPARALQGEEPCHQSPSSSVAAQIPRSWIHPRIWRFHLFLAASHSSSSSWAHLSWLELHRAFHVITTADFREKYIRINTPCSRVSLKK